MTMEIQENFKKQTIEIPIAMRKEGKVNLTLILTARDIEEISEYAS